MPPRLIVDSLLLQLQTAADRTAGVEQRISGLIAENLPGWTGEWTWAPPGAIEVRDADGYSAAEIANATLALRFAGFVDIRIHDHNAKHFLSCVCNWRRG